MESLENLEHTLGLWRMILALAATVIVLAFAAKRVLWLTTLISSGQPVKDEKGRKNEFVKRMINQNKEVFAQTKLLKWSIPGIAHFFTMWGFFILGSVYLEAYGVLFNPRSTSRSSAGGRRWASSRTSSPSLCWPASSCSRPFGSARIPRNSVGSRDSMARTTVAPGPS